MEMPAPIPVFVLFAPTACGKTALVKNLFAKGGLSLFKGRAEIISADSQAVYRYMDIGTAKPSPEERKEIPYHLVDVLEPDCQFGAGDFVEAADRLCPEIFARGNLPVVAGGTGFYISSFLKGLPETPQSDPVVREKIKARLAAEGNGALYHELKTVDRTYAKKISIHDGFRIVRALEVYYSTGRPLSSFEIPESLRKMYSFCTVILSRSREDLYSRIDKRVDLMFEQGLEKEIENLKKKGYGADSPGMKAIGYSEFFRGDADKAQIARIKEEIKHSSRRYAKRQYTIMRSIPGARVIELDENGFSDGKPVEELVSTELERFCALHPEWGL